MTKSVARVVVAGLPPLVLGTLLAIVAAPDAVSAGPVPMVGWTPAVESAHSMIPAFARKYEMECTECHSAWPTLNAYGREFKLNGYRLPGEEEELDDESNQVIAEDLALDRKIPITIRGVMLPFDKRKGEDVAIQALHEVEIMIGARVGKQFSAWFEIEAENEEDFEVEVGLGLFGWHPAAEANVVVGWAPAFWTDPFATLAGGGRRMTLSRKGPLSTQFIAAERVQSKGQSVSFFGRAGAGQVTYIAGISAGGGDPEGSDSKDGFGRVMIDVYPGINLGGYVLSGTNSTTGMDLGYTFGGFDFQIEQGGFTVYGLVQNASGDLPEGGDDSVTTSYVEGFYIFETGVRGLSMLVPLARIDYLDDFTNLTANLNFYLTQNVKTYFEWWQNIDTPPGMSKDNRFAVVIDFAF